MPKKIIKQETLTLQKPNIQLDIPKVKRTSNITFKKNSRSSNFQEQKVLARPVRRPKSYKQKESKKLLPSVPDWITSKPSDEMRQLIRDHGYTYLKTLSDQGEILKTAGKHIRGFIDHLTQYGANFEEIEPSMMKSSYVFFHYIYMHLRNQIAKINKRVRNASITTKIDDCNQIEENPEMMVTKENSFRQKNQCFPQTKSLILKSYQDDNTERQILQNYINEIMTIESRSGELPPENMNEKTQEPPIDNQFDSYSELVLPKKEKSPYNCFVDYFYANYLTKVIGEKWNSLNQEEKQRFYNISKLDKDRYNREYEMLRKDGFFINQDGYKITDKKVNTKQNEK